jgi:AcrR family transcriptional regulator
MAVGAGTEIARRAGVGTGTVRRHFPTREDLFAAILLDRGRLWRSAQRRYSGRSRADGWGTLLRCC